jgi:hypothetical protein
MAKTPMRLFDSVAELTAADRGCIAITGSHGGLSAARYAIGIRPLLVVFNDAGVGRDAAGIAGLATLQAEGLAGCTVSHASARIGQACSTLDDGVISHVNAAAAALGIEPGQRCGKAIAQLARAATTPQEAR